MFMKAILFTWTADRGRLPIALWWFLIRPWRRERRITLDGMLFVSCGLLWFQDPLLNYFSTWSTYNTWMWNMGSWVQDIPGLGVVGEPGAMMAEPVLMNAPGYFFVLLCTMLGCWVMRLAKKRFPNINTFGLIGVVIAWTFFFDFVIEGLFLMPMGFPTPAPSRRCRSMPAPTTSGRSTKGSWGGVQAGLSAAALLHRRPRPHLRRARLDQVRGGFVRQQLTRFLAIFAACSAFFFVFYNIPAQFLPCTRTLAGRHLEALVLPDGHLR